MPALLNVRERIHVGLELELPFAWPLKGDQSAVVLWLAVPWRSVQGGLHLRLGSADHVQFCHPLDDLMARHRRFSCDQPMLSDVLGAQGAGVEAARGLLAAYAAFIQRGPGIFLARAIAVLPDTTLWGDLQETPSLERRSDGVSFRATGLRVHIGMLMGRNVP